MKKHRTKTEKMTFEDYYRSLADKSPKVETRDKLLQELDMKYSTFYQKFRSGTFDKLEREKIAEVLKREVTDLFPNHNQE